MRIRQEGGLGSRTNYNINGLSFKFNGNASFYLENVGWKKQGWAYMSTSIT